MNNVCPRCKERERDESKSGYCRPCRREYDREYRRRTNYYKGRQFRLHGITEEIFASVLDAQGGRCAICKTADTGTRNRWAIDHDHSCCPSGSRSCGKCIRGILCLGCNTALGIMKDDTGRLGAAIAYLEDWHARGKLFDRVPHEGS